jgi:hypothetical protein
MKLFIQILTSRLTQWAEQNNILPEDKIIEERKQIEFSKSAGNETDTIKWFQID